VRAYSARGHLSRPTVHKTARAVAVAFGNASVSEKNGGGGGGGTHLVVLRLLGGTAAERRKGLGVACVLNRGCGGNAPPHVTGAVFHCARQAAESGLDGK